MNKTIEMKEKTVIAVDAMGGDHAPDEIVKGAAEATVESPVNVILVGDEYRIKAILEKAEYRREQLEIVHTDDMITMEDVPHEAIRQKPEASMMLAAKLCSAGRAQGLVSAGNTGAYVLSASLNIPRIAGIRKTAIATVYPTRNAQKREDHFSLLLDIGANIHCSAEDMVQFALMGKIYASDIKGIKDPTVALLNIGKESYKGGKILSRVYKILDELPGVNFIGNIEGNDVMRGLSDVVVTEGYVGNIVTKTMEGIAETVSQLGRYAFKRRFLWRIGLIALSSGIRQLKQLTDYSEYGGAPLLGFKEIVIKAHGRSKAKAITNAVKLAAKSHRDNICGRIEKEIAEFESLK
ncbi:MAG: phosphate acyltransferase PlsX [Candidatus Marinimicrobia bacterium]|nr:phosphate acyltransferase PlsX [Candidatus Neomarinimicrobiota bacterium]MBL7066696.1 phosphate acyltransferase PlsX [Candidatus Neomarinimicrobiota bacterium]